MTHQELFDIVKNGKGCTYATLDYTSKVKLPQYCGLGTDVTKHVHASGLLVNHDYEGVINKHLAAKGLPATFKAAPLPWGVWEEFRKVISHKGKRYLRYYKPAKGAKFVTEYFVNGVPATDAQVAVIKAWESKQTYASDKQKVAGLDDDEQVYPLVLDFAHINYCKLFGHVWMSDEQEQAMQNVAA